ncbi:zinc-ribbon domain-containing protein [uncultured Rubinisphaera sp.]|uniref:zinc-ribbon domain-containing protein n=1 Tax=uncultured Rubinisphaera sp. TaxID=1678686 RepID=UPI0030D8CFA9
MPRHISDERKTAYYVGMGLQILGALLFASTFVTFLIHFGDFTDFEARARSDGFRAFGGMSLLIIGSIVRGIGARGLAGSGVLLDPEKARDELEPYSRMAGGMAKDALEEANINLGGEPTKVIMVKCRSCGRLNQESAKFCQECGAKL